MKLSPNVLYVHRALWGADEKRDMCLQLDPTEGPQRVRRRMMRAPTSVHEKHLLPDGVAKRRKKDGKCAHMDDYMYMYLYVDVLMNDVFVTSDNTNACPLSFIFENTAYHGMEGLLKKVVPQDGEEMLNNSMPWVCQSVSPDNCCKGSLVLCEYMSLIKGILDWVFDTCKVFFTKYDGLDLGTVTQASRFSGKNINFCTVSM